MQAIILLGPSAAGKSSLAMDLSKKLDGAIINCDAIQCYAGLPILTAQPDTRDLVSVPHHLYSYLPATQPNNVAQWLAQATSVIRNVLAEKKCAIICGGTGMYGCALTKGIIALPPSDPDILTALDAVSTNALYKEYWHADPVGAEAIGPHDRMRLLRAMSVYRQTDKPLSWWHAPTNVPPPTNAPTMPPKNLTTTTTTTTTKEKPKKPPTVSYFIGNPHLIL